MPTILMTGATGFLGSALAANLLAEGAHVKALSRNDPNGQRVRAAVDRAADGFGLELDDAHRALLAAAEVDFRDLQGTLSPGFLGDVTDVWNVAAEMSFALRKTLESADSNVRASAELYSLAARHAPECRRFYHVSTAFSVGFGNAEAREVVNHMPRLINPYQLTKWMAEVNLLQFQRELGLPVTVFRPSGVIGHSGTGWSAGGIGLYSITEGILYASRAGARRLQLDLKRDAWSNLVCIDTTVQRALDLMRERSGRQPVEIFNCVGDEELQVQEILEPAGDLLDVRVGYGPPRSTVDAEVHQFISRIKPFVDVTWNFHADNLKRVLGDAYDPQPMSQEVVYRSLAHYLADRLGVLSSHRAEGQELVAP